MSDPGGEALEVLVKIVFGIPVLVMLTTSGVIAAGIDIMYSALTLPTYPITKLIKQQTPFEVFGPPPMLSLLWSMREDIRVRDIRSLGKQVEAGKPLVLG